MNIENMTYGELRKIAALFANVQAAPSTKPDHPFVGQFVIARCYAAGVHAGEVVSVDGENVVLKDSYRLWTWKAKEGIALSGLAQSGLKPGCKIDTKNPLIYLTGVCELIPVSDNAVESFCGAA